MTNCPVCGETPRSEQQLSNGAVRYDCHRCGRFTLGESLSNGFLDGLMTPQSRAVLSHRLRRMQRRDGHPPHVALDGRDGKRRIKLDDAPLSLDDRLPSPAEQADQLILWIGDHQPSPGETIEIPASEVSAWIGAAITPNKSNGGYAWLLNQEEIKKLIEDRHGRFRLTMAGWERYEAIKREQITSRTAFMAMQFGDAELHRAVENHFKPAVARAGFELRLLTDGQPAGLIDDQLRVALRTSRFVIADLTDANNGAYWEAGFAEGLGLPVIYTCREKEFDEVDEHGRRKVHFDTSHLVTIKWDPQKLDDAANRLTATIRATLPGEARMMDA